MNPRININATKSVRRLYRKMLDTKSLDHTLRVRASKDNGLRYDQIERRRKILRKKNFKLNVRYRKAVA